MTIGKRPSRDERLRAQTAEYWERERLGLVVRLKSVRERRLDRASTLAAGSSFQVGKILVRDFLELTIVDEDELAATVLDAAEFYLLTAIERDDLSVYERMGQDDLGRAERLKWLTMARWLRDHQLDMGAFRQALQMKQASSERLFSSPQWREGDFALDEWMAEKIVAGAWEEAVRIHERFYDRDPSRLSGRRTTEEVLALVARALAQAGDGVRRQAAEDAIDGLYAKFTAWTKPKTRQPDLQPEEKFLYAYIRGKHFKGEDDPVRIVKLMKFGD